MTPRFYRPGPIGALRRLNCELPAPTLCVTKLWAFVRNLIYNITNRNNGIVSWKLKMKRSRMIKHAIRPLFIATIVMRQESQQGFLVAHQMLGEGNYINRMWPCARCWSFLFKKSGTVQTNNNVKQNNKRSPKEASLVIKQTSLRKDDSKEINCIDRAGEIEQADLCVQKTLLRNVEMA